MSIESWCSRGGTREGVLDQLYAQATVLAPIFRHKVQQWTVLSHALVPMARSWHVKAFLRRDFVLQGAVMWRQVQVAPLKGVERTIEN